MSDRIVTHAIIDMRHSRAFHVPADELDRYAGSWLGGPTELPPVLDVTGGRSLDVPEPIVERWFRESCERMKYGGQPAYTDLKLRRSDVERLWPRREPEQTFECDRCRRSYSRAVEAGHRAGCLGILQPA